MFNARDALERATGRERVLEVTLDEVPGAGGGRDVRVRVRDNGVGMSPDVAARVFEPFFTTKPAHRGAGLGLADALVRVRDAGGTIDCESAAGEGTTFTVRLPVATSAAARPAAAAAAGAPAQGETILVVDDEAAVRSVVARHLTRHGYRVVEAADAGEARVVLARDGATIALVLLDQSMPYESGSEAVASLKRLSDAPIVLFTGGITALPPGAAMILEKPAQASEILRVARELIARRERR